MSGFIRVKLLQCERIIINNQSRYETFDPIVRVNVKETEVIKGKIF